MQSNRHGHIMNLNPYLQFALKDQVLQVSDDSGGKAVQVVYDGVGS